MLNNSSLQHVLDAFIAQEALPAEYAATVEQWFLPLTEQLMQLISSSSKAPVVGISGCQGSGKSTLASLLVLLVRELMGLRAVNLSIDDFYHTHATRQQLASQIHPLLATRGVPGTHDVALALQTIEALREPGQVAIPRFNKAIDDRLPQEQWPQVRAPVDLIVLEGWCLCIPAQNSAQLQVPVNSLEAEEDTSGQWRTYVNTAIGHEYTDLYTMVDFLIMLKAPDFSRVRQWRGRQEEKLAAAQADGSGGADGKNNKIMNKQQLERFIQHYERITCHGLATLPRLADVVFQLTDAQTIAGKL